MPRWFHIVALATALALLPDSRSAAQNPPPDSGRVESIQIEGSKRFAPEQVLSFLAFKAGDTIHREDIQMAANQLARLGPFTDVRFRFGSAKGGIAITFQVQDAPMLPVSFDNFPWFGDDELTAAIRKTVGLYDGSAPEEGTMLDAMSNALEALLAARGIHAGVEHQLIARPDADGQMQLFKVVGPALRVASLEFADPLASSSAALHETLSDITGKAYSRYAIEVFETEQVRPLFVSQGFLRVHFGTPTIRLLGDPNKPLPDALPVVVSVDRGPQFHWAGVSWSGNTVFSDASLTALVGLTVGDVADGMKITAAWDRVHDEYAHTGYLDVQVTPQVQLDDVQARASYRVAIAEGLQYRMGDLIVTGLSLEAERRLRDAWTLQKGQVFDQDYFVRFVDKGARESFGNLPVHYDQFYHLVRRNAKTRVADVLLDFQ